MFLRDAVSDPAFLSCVKWVRRSGWAKDVLAWTTDPSNTVLLLVPTDSGGAPIWGVSLKEITADDWELVDPKDVCEGR